MKALAVFPTLAMLLVVVATALPASADTVYDNGPINGTSDGWTINFGFAVSDTFTVSGGTSTINGLSFGTFGFPGDVLDSVEISITSSEFGGTTYFNQVVSTTQTNCYGNQYGYLICTQNASFNGPTLGNGTYWINLQNAMVNTGDPVYWDENSGVGCQSPGCPSQASNNSVGTIPSESFTVLGTTSGGGGSVPEPGSLLLLMSGVIGTLGILRRKLQ